MKSNPEDDYNRPRDPIDTAGAYVILLVVAIAALLPMHLSDHDSTRQPPAVQRHAAVAQDGDAAANASGEGATPTDAY